MTTVVKDTSATTLLLSRSETASSAEKLASLRLGLPLEPLPALPPRDPSVAHAPVRPIALSANERKVRLAWPYSRCSALAFGEEDVAFHYARRALGDGCRCSLFSILYSL